MATENNIRRNDMTDTDIRDLVIKHDAHIDTLASSIEQLAIGVGSTNTRLESVIDMLSKQQVIEERVNNMDKELDESFDRVHTNIRELKDTSKETSVNHEKITVANKRIDKLEAATSSLPSSMLVRWVVGLFVLYAVSFGTYVVQSIHTSDTFMSTAVIERANIKEDIEDLEDGAVEQSLLLGRNFENIQMLKERD